MSIYTYTFTQVHMNKIKLKPTCQQQARELAPSRVKCGPSRRDAEVQQSGNRSFPSKSAPPGPGSVGKQLKSWCCSLILKQGFNCKNLGLPAAGRELLPEHSDVSSCGGFRLFLHLVIILLSNSFAVLSMGRKISPLKLFGPVHFSSKWTFKKKLWYCLIS